MDNQDNGMVEPNFPSGYQHQLDIKKIGERVPTSGLLSSHISSGDDEHEGASIFAEKRLKTTDEEHAKKKRDTHCFVCHKKGGEPLCKSCHRIYHRFCARSCTPCSEMSWAKSNNIPRGRMTKLIETIVVKLKEVDKEKVFHDPVDLSQYPDYLDQVVRPIDLGMMHQKAIDGTYDSFENFLTDVTQLYHNSIVYNTTAAWVTTLAAKLHRRALIHYRELKKCPTCFLRQAKNDHEWFLKTCSDPHLIVWAKVRSYPFWPAKCFGTSDGRVDVVFFGDHSKAAVKVKDCFLYGENLFQMAPSNAKPGYDKLLRNAKEELSEHLNRMKANWGEVRLATTKVAFDPESLSMQKILMFPYLSRPQEERPSLKRPHSNESDSSGEFSLKEGSPMKKVNLLPCAVVLERCDKMFLRELEQQSTERQQSIDSRVEDDTSSFLSSDFVDCRVSQTSPYITKVLTLHESDAAYSRAPHIREELMESPRLSTSSHNAVSSTSDANATSADFDADFYACCETVFQMTDRVVRLCTDGKETQVEPDRKDLSTQTVEKQVPCELGKIAVRKDLMENRNSTVTPVSMTVTPILPPSGTALESFEITNMADHLVEAFRTTVDRKELLHKVFDITEKVTVQHKKDLEAAKTYLVTKHANEISALQVERVALVHKLKKAEAIGAHCQSHLLNYSDEDTDNPIGMMASAPTAFTSQPRPKKCSRCQMPSSFDCCPEGAYCTNICQSEDWIHHSKKCHKFKEALIDMRKAGFSGNSLGQLRSKRTPKLRKATGGGSAALSSHSPQGNANLLSLPSTSSSPMYPRNLQLDSLPSRNVRSAASDKGGKLTMAARKMMPPNLSDMDSLAHGASKRQWKRPVGDAGS